MEYPHAEASEILLSEASLIVANRRAWRGVLRVICLLCLLTASRMSWGQQEVAFDFDDPPETDIRITDSLSYGIEVELEGFHTEELDLDNFRTINCIADFAASRSSPSNHDVEGLRHDGAFGGT